MSEERVAAYVHACSQRRTGCRGLPVSAGANRWIRWITIGCVVLLALIAGAVSYLVAYGFGLNARAAAM